MVMRYMYIYMGVGAGPALPAMAGPLFSMPQKCPGN